MPATNLAGAAGQATTPALASSVPANYGMRWNLFFITGQRVADDVFPMLFFL